MDRNQAIVTTLLMSFLLSAVAGWYPLFSKQCKPVHHNCVIRGVSLAKARLESRLQQGSKIATTLTSSLHNFWWEHDTERFQDWNFYMLHTAAAAAALLHLRLRGSNTCSHMSWKVALNSCCWWNLIFIFISCKETRQNTSQKGEL